MTSNTEKRLALLEHALHETRQRCDLLTAALFEAGQVIATEIYGASSSGGTVDALVGQDLGALAQAVGAQFDRPLEPDHNEGDAPEWSDPDDGDTPPTHDEAQLLGARRRFERRDELRADDRRYSIHCTEDDR